MFFIARLWIISHNYFVTGICVILCSLRLGFGIVCAWASFHIVGFSNFDTQYRWAISAGFISSLECEFKEPFSSNIFDVG